MSETRPEEEQGERPETLDGPAHTKAANRAVEPTSASPGLRDQTPGAVRLCRIDEVEPGTAKRFDVGDHRIAVVRIGDDWYAVGDECSHADYSLSEGELDEEECAIECWKHGSLFSLTTGEPLTLPATKPVPVYPLTVGETEVSVTLPSVTPNTRRNASASPMPKPSVSPTPNASPKRSDRP